MSDRIAILLIALALVFAFNSAANAQCSSAQVPVRVYLMYELISGVMSSGMSDLVSKMNKIQNVKATVLAIADELTEDGLVLRYRVEETADGLTGEEGTFTICSFWLVSALVEIGEVDRAKALCERLLSFASSLNLYAEEIDPTSGRHLGNFPQAFTHLALINAVMHVIRAEQGDPQNHVFGDAEGV
jgi:hypothetical protein